MKRLALLGLLAAATTLLAGCPIFDDSQTGPGCYDNCGTGGSPTTTPPGTCGAQKDCTGINETCGADGFCHTGDCTLWGCVGGQTCSVVDQKATCGEAPSHGGAGGTSMGGASMGGASMGGAMSAGGMGGAIVTGGAGGATATGGAGGATATGGSGGIGVSGGSGGVGGM